MKNNKIALSVKISALILMAGISLAACKSSGSDTTWITEALISESTIPSFNVVKGDYCLPKLVIPNKNIIGADLMMINDAIMEINKIAGLDYAKLTSEINNTSKASCTPSPIFINISEYKHRAYKEYFISKYRLVLGDDDYEYAVQKGLSTSDELGSANEVPCFAHGVYSSIEANKTNDGYHFLRSTNPKFWFIQIGYRGTMIDREFKHCLREELAHALFSIPDRLQQKDNETIFNIPSKHESPYEFTNKDKQLINFIANNPDIIGMSESELNEYIITIQKKGK
jgi:hypothetical protein